MNSLQDIPGKVSFTFDTWTSDPGDPFLSVTSHYIHTQPDKPNDWKLRTEKLVFLLIEGHHTGANMVNLLVCTVDRYSLRPKASFYLF